MNDQCDDPKTNLLKFLKIVVFNYLIGNGDAHSKNFSLLYRGKSIELAPAYDILSTAVYSNVSPKTSMGIDGKNDARQVARHHLYGLLENTPVSQAELNSIIDDMTSIILEKAIELEVEFQSEEDPVYVCADIIKIIEERIGYINRTPDDPDLQWKPPRDTSLF